MTKQDIDQSETSWLIYSDYLEEDGQLALAEQIRFELDYKPSNYPPPYAGVDVGNYGYGRDIGVGSYVGWSGVAGNRSINVGSIFGSVGGYGDVSDYGDVGGHYD